MIQDQRNSIDNLTNLAASKNIESFAALQSISNNNMPMNTFNVPMDNHSVANRMMDEYREFGIDPNLAVNREDPLEEFGGTNSMI